MRDGQLSGLPSLSYSGYVQIVRGTGKIWPHWLRSVGVIVDQGVVVRVACTSCLSIFDVDVRAIAEKRGREFTLIDARPICKISTCRGRSVFVAARSMRDPFVTLLTAGGDPCGLDGRRPIDFEPPEPISALAAIA